MRQGNATYIGYFWTPTAREEELKQRLRTYPTTSIERFENHSIKPPTYIKTNDFTYIFQEIVNTYGVPMHEEINPAVFAIVTFPFLFGVMFGDVGHGFLLLLMGIILCILHPKFRNNLQMEAVFSMRYILLLMGFFAMFCGLIYNEFFAIPMNIFGGSDYEEEVMAIDGASRYGYIRKGSQIKDSYPSQVYPFGFDPVWFKSDQLLTFTNNFKMKLAVIFAIIQMSIGIVLKGMNSLHFRNKLDFFFEFIPQFLLLFALFGWMDILILAKWNEKKNVEDLYYGPCPSDALPEE